MNGVIVNIAVVIVVKYYSILSLQRFPEAVDVWRNCSLESEPLSSVDPGTAAIHRQPPPLGVFGRSRIDEN